MTKTLVGAADFGGNYRKLMKYAAMASAAAVVIEIAADIAAGRPVKPGRIVKAAINVLGFLR